MGKIVYQVVNAVWEKLSNVHLAIPNNNNFLEIAAGYEERWNFPNAVGSIDGKHIRVKCPVKSGSLYYNYKHFFSIVLQAVADYNCRFTFIDVGGYGKQSDGGTFSASALYKFLENHEKTLPPPACLPGSAIDMPFVLLGDDAYPLKTFLMKPFTKRNLSNEEAIFNYRLSRARRTVECAFGIITAKWRLLIKAIETTVEKAERIVKCVCLLHNICIDREGILPASAFQQDFNEYHRQGSFTTNGNRMFNRSTRGAQEVREAFKCYFNSPQGSVPWQNKCLTLRA